MIILLEPRHAADMTSGGFRYQQCIFDRLAPTVGRRIATTPAELDSRIARLRSEQPSAILVVDGLFAELRSEPLPPGTVALLHMVPTRLDWCLQPMHVIATSATTAERIANRSLSTTVVRPGIDACFRQARHARQSNEAAQLVCVGTIAENKAQARLVRLLKSIRQPWQLALIGSYTQDDAELLRVRSLGEGLPVALHGVVSIEEVAYRFARADLLVSLSRDESFGMAVAEAAAAGLPVLALATGEIESFIHHGQNGWTLPNTMADDELSMHLQDLLHSPSKLEAAKAARRSPALADWDAVAKDFVVACIRAAGPQS